MHPLIVILCILARTDVRMVPEAIPIVIICCEKLYHCMTTSQQLPQVNTTPTEPEGDPG